MADLQLVAGADFGTLSVRVSIFDAKLGRLGSATSDYPLHRTKDDPGLATQRHTDHLAALEAAMQGAIKAARVDGRAILALACDTTGSSIVPVDASLTPLDDYYLWCDHRAWREAAAITETAHREKLEAIDWCGGSYSSEWGLAKSLHWLRANPERAGEVATFLEHCDMTAAVLCGITDPALVPRSICAAGHKWMWNEALGGLPSEEFLLKVDTRFAGLRAKQAGPYRTSDKIAGRLTSAWAAKLGLRAGIPIPAGAFDAHWDAVGAGIREGGVVNVAGTSACIMAIAKEVALIPGVSGVVKGSIHPDYYGIEAGLAAMGDIFEAIARRAGTNAAKLSEGLERYGAGQTGLLRITWDNGDRNILANPQLGGVTLGWNLTHTAQDELFAAIEGTAFHTRAILERMQEYGVPVDRIINGGGIPQRNETLNRVFASVMDKPVLVPSTDVTSLGSAIFAFLAAGVFKSVEEAQDALCPAYRVVKPDDAEAAVYARLYPLWRRMYDSLGASTTLPELRSIAGGAK